MAKLKVHIEPNFTKPDNGEGGVRRVIDAQRKYLPEFGIEIVDKQAKADLTVGHGTLTNLKAGAPYVHSSHGLQWSDYPWDGWANEVNRAVIDAMLCADAITIPTQWVKRAFGRGMMRDMTVVYHGIDWDEWQHTESNAGYVLWNKPRHDIVSDSLAVPLVARQMPDVKFVTTFAPTDLPNLKKLGQLPYAEMRPVIQRAGVYLATARETFGIGTLEALAAGIPVAGWRHGGQVEIIIEGETGYLAEPGNYDQLVDCVRKCIAQRKRLSNNAREDAKRRWQWSDKIGQYAALYQRIAKSYNVKPKVSIILTCHNLARYLPNALESIEQQTFVDWECVIIDDFSTDNTEQVAKSFTDPRFVYQKTPFNLKLSGARNFGLEKAKGKYILHLDADDMLTPNALELLTASLDKDPALHIAYGGLDLISEDGGSRRTNAFPPKFNWLNQMAHLNSIPYCTLMRRQVLELTGGYRERQWRAEDAEMWCRVTSYGYRAVKVTDAPIIVYRVRADSKGALERKQHGDLDGEWTAGFPWHIAKTGAEGTAKLQQQKVKLQNTHLIPFGAPVLAGEFWKVPHCESPDVSIIIPLGVGHERYIIDALDSLVAQTVGNWEAIVVNDTGKAFSEIAGAQYARIIATQGKQGAGVARNVGIQSARAPLVLFLDADDMLRPDALKLMLERYAKGDCGYVYTDWTTILGDSTTKAGRANDYQPIEWLHKGQHAITVLMATEDARRSGGFDEEMPGWEDWDFFVKLNINGICGAHIAEALLNYREFTGSRRSAAFQHKEELTALLQTRYKDYLEGSRKIMPCGGGCGGAKKAARQSVTVQETKTMATNEVRPERVRMEFLGRQTGPITYTVNNHSYSGANTEENRYSDVLYQDVAKLERLGVWRRAPEPQIPLPPPPEEIKPPEAVKPADVVKPPEVVVTPPMEVFKTAEPVKSIVSEPVAVETYIPPRKRKSRKVKADA